MKITTASADQTFTYGVSTNSGNAKTVWGDGETTAASAGGSHTYETPGEYIIEIHPTGSTSFKGFSAWSTPLVPLITEIMQWGDIEWEDNNWFLAEGAVYTLTATDVPNLSGVTSLANMFSAGTYGDNTLFSGGDAIGNWDVSTITNMHHMFKEVTSSSFTQDLSAWDVSNVTDMSGMFRHYPGYAQSYISPVINWGNKTRNVENFSAFFVGKKLASFIDNSGVGEFNTSSATNVASMFQQNDSFVNLNTRKINAGTADEYIAWDVKKVSNFSAFAWSGTGRFSQSNFPSNWYISGDGQDVNMYSMFGNFSGGVALDNLTDVDSFATKTITAESSAYGTEYSAWNMSNVTSLSAFARKLSSSLNFNIGSWNITNKMTNMSYMFSNYLNNATVFPRLDQDVSGWDISNVTSMDNIWFNRHSQVLKGVTFSTENYDALLISWSAQNTQFTSLNMGDSQYTQGGAAEAARQTLASAGVVITDGGPVLKEFFYDGGDGESSSSGACSLEATDTRGYFYGSGSYPAEGDELYTASVRDESNILTEGYYKIATADNTFSYAFVGADGSIEEFGECSTSVQYNYGNADRGQEGACNARSLDNTFYVAEEIGEEMPSTLYSDAALTTAINFSRSADGYYPFQLNGSNTRQTFNLSRGRFGAIGSCR